MKKVTRKSIVKRLDTLVSQIVRAREPYCVLCGSTQRLQAGHLFSRVNYSTRWDLTNVWTQCASCNFKHELYSWPFYKWFITKFGQSKFDELYAKHNQVSKLKDYQLEELYQELKELQ